MVKIKLDRERVLAFSLNSMAEIFRLTGQNVFDSDVLKKLVEDVNPVSLRLLLWACLLDDDPDLTLEGAGKLVNSYQQIYSEVSSKIIEVISEAMSPKVQSPG